jgi:predicted permease
MRREGEARLPFRMARWILRAAARAAPSAWREEGLAEWEGELWALASRRAGAGELLRFGLDGAMHAIWLKAQEGRGMSGLLEDVRLAGRRLLRSPGFSAVTVLLLALGIGANTALFGALTQALRGAGRYPAADRLVMVDMMLARNADSAPDTFPWSYPKFDLVRPQMRSLAATAGFAVRMGTLTGAGDATRLAAEVVSPVYFDLLGVAPLLGRPFTDAEEPPAPGAVAILGHALWTERFGGDPGVLGRTVTIDGASFEVVGVMPDGFRGLTGRAQLWLPMSAYNALGTPGRLGQPWSHWFRVVGRLASGTTLEQARAELTGLGPVLTDAFPDPNGGGAHGVAVVPFLHARVNPVARLAVAAVAAGGLLLLLIGCANVAGLLFARASSRRTDVAVRAALGAERRRLVRESLAESLLLAGTGGAVGVLLAMLGDGVIAWAVRYALETSGTRTLEFLNPDALVAGGGSLAVGMGLALGIGLIAGLFPLRAAARPDLGRELRSSSAGGFQRRGLASDTVRGVLVSAQLALTLVLLAGGGLMAASFSRLAGLETGFQNENVLVLRFDGGPGRSAAEARAFERDALARIRALPGVTLAATAPCPPLSGMCEVTGVRQVDSDPPLDFDRMESILTYEVSPEYFRTLGIRVLEGRELPEALGPSDAPLAIVNQAAARKLFGGSGVGHRIAVTHALTEERQAEVVGVVEDVRYGGLEDEVIPTLYLSRGQATPGYGTLLVQTSRDPEDLIAAVQGAVREVNRDVPLTDVTTLAELKAVASARTRVLLGLLAAYSLLGLLLSAVGIYGAVSYDVARRTRETGLRLALGASATQVLRTVVSRPALFAAGGGLLGIAAAVLLTRQMGPLLFGVEPGDARVLGAAALVLVAVAVGAAWLPTRRALSLDPAETLRGE